MKNVAKKFIRGAGGIACLAMLLALTAQGQDTWVGNTSANWADSNWTGHNPPLTGDGLIFDVAGTAGSSLTDNLTTGAGAWTFTNITFTANAPAYTVTPGAGAGFTLGTTTPATVIAQNGGNLQVIHDPITLANASQTISLTAGNLTLGGLPTSGQISGAGGLTLIGSVNVLTLTTNSAGLEAYTGATVVNSGELDLNFANLSLGGIYTSSSLTINNGGTVNVLSDNSLAGFGSPVGSLPVTINLGGTLMQGATASGSHIRGLLTLNGGTLAAGGAGTATFGNWHLDDGVVVNGGVNQSVISSGRVIPFQTGGTVFNVASGGTASGIDLDVTGDLYNGTTDHDTGIIKTGNGTMALESVNTYIGATTVSNGILVINGTLGVGSSYAGRITNFASFVYNGFSAQTLSGVISGPSSLVQSNGLLTLSATNTYIGSTVIAGGTMSLTGGGSLASSNIMVGSGTTFDVSAVNFALGSGQTLSGSGTVNGSVSGGAGSRIDPGIHGAGAAVGTLTINNNLTLGVGASAAFDLGTTFNGPNDQINVGGILTNDFDVVHISAPTTSSLLDASGNDYVLITASGGVSGGISGTPVWDVAPANSTNFVVLVSGNNVVLHYLASGVPTPPSGVASASPSTLNHGQSTIVSATVTNGTFPISTVVLDASAIGGSSSISLVRSNSTSVYTNSVVVGLGASLGSQTLVVVVTDNQGHASLPITASVSIAAAGEVWNGLGANDNWSTSLNWSSGLAPGYAGDNITFAGATRLTPNVDTNYSVTALTFNNTAGSFTIGTANASTLTLSGGGVTNNSANAQTLNVPISLSAPASLNAAAGSLVVNQNITNGTSLLTITATNNVNISGAINGTTGGLTKNPGTGTLALSGANTYGGATTISGGTLSLTGSGALTPAGDGTGASRILVGNVAGVPAALYQSGGTIATSAGTGGNLQIASALGAWGYYNLSGGLLIISNTAANGAEINVGGTSATAGAGTLAQFDMSGGTVLVGVVGTTKAYFQASRGGVGVYSVVNLSGGSLIVNTNITDDNGAGYSANWSTAAGSSTNVTTISGTATLLSPTVSTKLNQRNNATSANIGILNLNGGLLQTFGFYAAGNASATINFNGGTLMAGFTNAAESFTNAASFLGNVGSVYDYNGGAFINDNGYAIAIKQPVLAPTGNGVTSIPVATGGAGYVMPPLIMITGGNGSGATAYAQVNPVTGAVTNIVVTCAGRNYTTAPTVTLLGGGATTAATLGAATLGANTSGGLAKSGSGSLYLAGANTYTGTTTVSNGTLLVNSTQPNTAPVVVKDGATLGVIASGSGQFSPSSLTVGNSTGASLAFVVNSTTQAPLTPAAFSHTGNYTINILAGSLVAGNSYPLLTLGSTPSGYTLGTLPLGVSANLSTTGNTLYLNVTAVAGTLWTGSVSGIWDIATTLNWTNSGVASTYTDGSPVQFDDTASVFLVAGSVSTTVSPSDVLVTNNVNNYNISNNLVIAGLGGLTKNGSGALTIGPGAFNGPYTYAGPTVVNGGTLNLNFGNFPNSGIYASSGLFINSNATVVTMINNSLCGSASPLGSLPVTINAGGTLTAAVGQDSSHIRGLLTLIGGTLGDLGVGNQGANGTWDIDSGVVANGGQFTSTMSANDMIPDQIGGTVFKVASGGTPSGIDLNVTGSMIRGTALADTGIIKTGNGVMAIAGVTNSYSGPTTISNGLLTINGGSSLGAGAVYAGAISNFAAFAYNSTHAQFLSGVISGSGVLSISNASALVVLTNVNTYTGPTIVAAGTLALTNTASIAASTSIQVNSGAILDVSSATSRALALAAGQTLDGNGLITGSVTNLLGGTIEPGTPAVAGVLTVTNIVTLGGSGNTLMVLNSGGSSSKLIATNINYGGTLTLNNVGPAYAAGNSFTLFQAVNYSGTFTSLVPATPGAGLGWDTSALNTSGVLSVVTASAPISALKFTSRPVISGTTLTFSATNTGAGSIYLLTSTNIANQLNTWTPIWTNVLGGSSSFTTNLLNAVNPAYSQDFYILSTTNNH